MSQPRQFGVEYASIFQDASVVAAYPHRPPYPPQTFAMLAGLIDRSVSPARLLDAGCGTGQMTSGLLAHADQIDAVDVSVAMIEAGRAMAYGADTRINWIVGRMEEVALQPPYALIVAAASLHWMPWQATLPRFAQALSPHGYLALVEGRSPPGPWADELTLILAHYSMNQDFQPYNMGTIAAELQQRSLFRQVGVMETQPVRFRQSVDAWIASIHAGNGFSRDRMAPERAAAFDQHARTVMRKHCPTGVVDLPISARIIWGKPLTQANGER